MSVIETPPGDRHPITTYVVEHDRGVIAQAINKELRRNGQVYYVHNRIESIYSCAADIHSMVPEANIGIAHGRMSEEELLDVWRRLIEGEIDVLVCTTLIETGVDVPNCNTLIIENAVCTSDTASELVELGKSHTIRIFHIQTGQGAKRDCHQAT